MRGLAKLYIAVVLVGMWAGILWTSGTTHGWTTTAVGAGVFLVAFLFVAALVYLNE